ncbi:hypothetical protein EPK84_21270 [Sinorhizobium fredii]|nr:hypothetical protein EPK84_21270 [Sinorhizobium fredii]
MAEVYACFEKLAHGKVRQCHAFSPFPVEPPQGVEHLDAPTGGIIRISPGKSHASRVEWQPLSRNCSINQDGKPLFIAPKACRRLLARKRCAVRVICAIYTLPR